MTNLSKFFALVMFAAGAAAISFVVPSQAQAGRTAISGSAVAACRHNVLTIEVRNGSAGPAGLDVSENVSGNFSRSAPGRPCPCSRPYDRTTNPN